MTIDGRERSICGEERFYQRMESLSNSKSLSEEEKRAVAATVKKLDCVEDRMSKFKEKRADSLSISDYGLSAKYSEFPAKLEVELKSVYHSINLAGKDRDVYDRLVSRDYFNDTIDRLNYIIDYQKKIDKEICETDEKLKEIDIKAQGLDKINKGRSDRTEDDKEKWDRELKDVVRNQRNEVLEPLYRSIHLFENMRCEINKDRYFHEDDSFYDNKWELDKSLRDTLISDERAKINREFNQRAVDLLDSKSLSKKEKDRVEQIVKRVKDIKKDILNLKKEEDYNISISDKELREECQFGVLDRDLKPYLYNSLHYTLIASKPKIDDQLFYEKLEECDRRMDSLAKLIDYRRRFVDEIYRADEKLKEINKNTVGKKWDELNKNIGHMSKEDERNWYAIRDQRNKVFIPLDHKLHLFSDVFDVRTTDYIYNMDIEKTEKEVATLAHNENRLNELLKLPEDRAGENKSGQIDVRSKTSGWSSAGSSLKLSNERRVPDKAPEKEIKGKNRDEDKEKRQASRNVEKDKNNAPKSNERLNESRNPNREKDEDRRGNAKQIAKSLKGYERERQKLEKARKERQESYEKLSDDARKAKDELRRINRERRQVLLSNLKEDISQTIMLTLYALSELRSSGKQTALDYIEKIKTGKEVISNSFNKIVDKAKDYFSSSIERAPVISDREIEKKDTDKAGVPRDEDKKEDTKLDDTREDDKKRSGGGDIGLRKAVKDKFNKVSDYYDRKLERLSSERSEVLKAMEKNKKQANAYVNSPILQRITQKRQEELSNVKAVLDNEIRATTFDHIRAINTYQKNGIDRGDSNEDLREQTVTEWGRLQSKKTALVSSLDSSRVLTVDEKKWINDRSNDLQYVLNSRFRRGDFDDGINTLFKPDKEKDKADNKPYYADRMADRMQNREIDSIRREITFIPRLSLKEIRAEMDYRKEIREYTRELNEELKNIFPDKRERRNASYLIAHDVKFDARTPYGEKLSKYKDAIDRHNERVSARSSDMADSRNVRFAKSFDKLSADLKTFDLREMAKYRLEYEKLDKSAQNQEYKDFVGRMNTLEKLAKASGRQEYIDKYNKIDNEFNEVFRSREKETYKQTLTTLSESVHEAIQNNDIRSYHTLQREIEKAIINGPKDEDIINKSLMLYRDNGGNNIIMKESEVEKADIDYDILYRKSLEDLHRELKEAGFATSYNLNTLNRAFPLPPLAKINYIYSDYKGLSFEKKSVFNEMMRDMDENRKLIKDNILDGRDSKLSKEQTLNDLLSRNADNKYSKMSKEERDAIVDQICEDYKKR